MNLLNTTIPDAKQFDEDREKEHWLRLNYTRKTKDEFDELVIALRQQAYKAATTNQPVECMANTIAAHKLQQKLDELYKA